MERTQLNAVTRQGKGKGPARRTRMQGAIPGILYGLGKDSVLVSVNAKELGKALKVAGTNAIFDLQIEGQKAVPAMVKDYQAHVLTREFIHVDFLQVDLTKKIVVDVPIHLEGKAPGVKDGGILEHISRNLKVRCLATSIPEYIRVDVSKLNIGDNIHSHEISLPEGVEMLPGADVTIAAVVAPKEEKVEAPTGEVTQPEVLTAKAPAEGAADAAGGDKKAGGEKKQEKK